MVLRHGWLLLSLLGLSCHSVFPVQPATEAVQAARLWEEGQAAMRRGQVDVAIRRYEDSLFTDPELVRNHLSLAAAYLERGDPEAACPHLGCYVAACPDHLAMRAHYAELLLRLRQLPTARAEYEHFVAQMQDQGKPAYAQLIHCHSRLMEIAEATDDVYGEHLHRGIGLYLLACEREALTDLGDELPAEGMYCKAAGELSLARLERPTDARPCWYLHEVWAHLGQRQPAGRWLREADRDAPFSTLTPAEQRGLHMACQRQATRSIP
jgi:tetratricopeptide (TPR) repeat protein